MNIRSKLFFLPPLIALFVGMFLASPLQAARRDAGKPLRGSAAASKENTASPADERLDTSRIRALLENGDGEQALALLKPMLAKGKESGELLFLRSAARLAAGDGEGALVDARKAASLAPKRAEVLSHLGMLLARAGKIGEARPLFERAVRADPDDLKARVNLAVCRDMAKDPEGALAELDEALRRHPTSADGLAARARLKQEHGDLAGAEADLRALVKVLPDGLSTSTEEKVAAIAEERRANGDGEPMTVGRATATAAEGSETPSVTTAEPTGLRAASEPNRRADRPGTSRPTPRSEPLARPVPEPSPEPSSDPSLEPISEPVSEPVAEPPSQRAPARTVSGPQPANPDFAGFPVDACETRSNWTTAGAPWGPPPATPARDEDEIPTATSPFSVSEYLALVTRVMEKTGVLRGALDQSQREAFQKFWAPYFEHPNRPSFLYFQKFEPLLDRQQALTGLCGALYEALQQSSADLLLAARLGDPGTLRGSWLAARTQRDSLGAARQRLAKVVERIKLLGDPPNPLEQQHKARQRHRTALAAAAGEGASFDGWELVDHWIVADPVRGEGGNEWAEYVEGSDLSVTMRTHFNRTHDKTARDEDLRDYYGFQQFAWSWDIPQTVRVGEPMNITVEICDRQSSVDVTAETPQSRPRLSLDLFALECYGRGERNKALEPNPFWPWVEKRVFFEAAIRCESAYTSRSSPLMSDALATFEPGGSAKGLALKEETTLRSGGMGSPFEDGTPLMREAVDPRERLVLLVRPALLPDAGACFVYVYAPTGVGKGDALSQVVVPWNPQTGAPGERRADRARKQAGGGSREDARAMANGKKPQGTGPAKDLPDPLTEALARQARSEAIAARREVVLSLDGAIARFEADLESARNDASPAGTERYQELYRRMLEQKHNRQKELDLIESLRTGTMVNTRTELQELDHLRFVDSIQAELAGFDHENRMIRGISRLAGMIDSGEGSELRGRLGREITAAIVGGDRVAALKRIQGEVGASAKAFLAQSKTKAAARETSWDRQVALAEGVQAASGFVLMLGTFGAPQVGYVALTYGVGTGWAEGGPKKAAENGLRAVSDVIDVGWAFYDGVKDRVDEKGKKSKGSIEQGLWNAGLTFLLNKGMGKLTDSLQQGRGFAPHFEIFPAKAPPDPVLRLPQARAPGSRVSPDPAYKPSKPSTFDGFKSPEQRLDEDLAAVRRRFPGASDDSPQVRAEIDKVKRNHEVVVKRREAHDEIARITAEHEARITDGMRLPDGTPDPTNADYRTIKREWETRLAEAKTRHNEGENRASLIDDIVAGLGMNRGENAADHEIRWSGGRPETIASDIDLTPRDPEAASRLMGEFRNRGHQVLEFPDRYIIPGIDCTVWKPVTPGSPKDLRGSAAHSARVTIDAYRGSDKFSTVGGVAYTSNVGPRDPRGAVLANAKKAVEAGIGGGNAPPDLHVVGKSLDKAAQIAAQEKALAGLRSEYSAAGKDPGRIDPNELAARTRSEREKLFSGDVLTKAEKVRKHQTPEQAGVVTFGASPERKRRELDEFMGRARETLTTAYHEASTRGEVYDAARRQQLHDAIVSGDAETVRALRGELVDIHVSNEATMLELARQDPSFMAKLLDQDLTEFDPGAFLAGGRIPDDAPLRPTAPGDDPPGSFGWGWMVDRLARLEPPAPPPDLLQPDAQTPISAKGRTLATLAERCSTAAETLSAKLLPKLDPKSPEAAQLKALRTVLEQGADRPDLALGNCRRLTGSELPNVLAEIDQVTGGKPRK